MFQVISEKNVYQELYVQFEKHYTKEIIIPTIIVTNKQESHFQQVRGLVTKNILAFYI